MLITNQIRESHERLSKTGSRFLDFVNENPESLKRSSYKDLLALNDYLFKMQPWPTFISQQTKKEIMEATIKTLQLIKKIPKSIFSNDSKKLSDYYGIPVALADRFLDGVSDEHLENLMGRGDFIVSPFAGIKCIEYNVNTNLGGIQTPVWESTYLRIPIISKFLREHGIKIHNKNLFSCLFEHLIDSTLNTFSHAIDEINVAFVSQEKKERNQQTNVDPYLDLLFKNVLAFKDPRLKGEVIFCSYSHLKTSGDYVFYKDKKVHFIIEWCFGFVPDTIMEVFRMGNVLIANGAICWLLSTKLNLALLSEHEDSDIFSPGEKESIKKYIPWTRKVQACETNYRGENIQLRDFILSNRETLVLKPLVGSGGKDIYIGKKTTEKEWKELVELAFVKEDWKDIKVERDMTQEQWNHLIENALDVKSWLVQENIESYPYLYQIGENGYTEHHAAWGFFIFGSRYSGGWLRILPKDNPRGIINSHQGAEVSSIFEVDR